MAAGVTGQPQFALFVVSVVFSLVLLETVPRAGALLLLSAAFGLGYLALRQGQGTS